MNSKNQLSSLKPKENPSRQTVQYEVQTLFLQPISPNLSKPIWAWSYYFQSLHQQWLSGKLSYMSAFVTGRLRSHSDDITAACLNPGGTCSGTRVTSCQWGPHNPSLFKKDKINQLAENDKNQLSQSVFNTILCVGWNNTDNMKNQNTLPFKRFIYFLFVVFVVVKKKLLLLFNKTTFNKSKMTIIMMMYISNKCSIHQRILTKIDHVFHKKY